ncbi:Transmembrane protein 45B [Mactra antiquata]
MEGVGFDHLSINNTMGSFAGHIDEGIIFIVLAVWWFWNIWKRHTKTSDRKTEYTSYLSYTTTVRGRSVPLEAILKVLFPFGAIWAEVFSAESFINEEGQFSYLSNMQHMTVYMLFLLHGILEIIRFYRPNQFEGMSYLAVCLGFLWYGTTFYYHSMPNMGKEELENIIHRLPIPVIMVCGLCLIFECIWRHSVYPQLIRTYCVLTVGTWFTYTSFVLFLPYPFPGPHHNPAWDQSDERNVHFMVVAFGIHLNINLIFVLLSTVVLTVFKRMFYACADGNGNNDIMDVKYSLLDTSDDTITSEENV